MTATFSGATAIDRVIERLLAKGSEGKGGSWRCPAHEDSTPSLSVSRNKTGNGVVLHCHAGCPTDQVMDALDMTPKDLYDEAPASQNGRGQPTAIYRYTGEDGRTLFEVLRYPGKKFLQRRPVPGGY
ncbi:MAG: hypothetical protein ACR2MN_04275 [Acidimicrobiales bacterium]